MTAAQRNMLRDWFRQHGLTAILIPLCFGILTTMLSMRDSQVRTEGRIEAVVKALSVHQEQQEKRSVQLRVFHEMADKSCMKCPSMGGN